MLKQFPASRLLVGDLASVTPTCDPHPAVKLPASAASLSDVERRVILLARRDPATSVGPVSRRERLVQLALGVRPTTRLSDPRLEALRRFVITRRRGKGSREQLLAMGHSAGQAALVEIMAGRVRRRSGIPGWISAVAAALAMAGGSWEALGYFRDLLVSVMLSGTGVATLLPLLQQTDRR
jgi:hypothetical protein